MKKKHNTHDSGYKMLFSNHEMVRQLLTSFVDEEWIYQVDYSTLERIDKSFVSDKFEERESDIIYRVRLKGNDVYIFILMEFQSTVDRFMALRMLHYIAELYEHLVKNHKLKKLPPVFPVMLYNGERKWTAPVKFESLIEGTISEKYVPAFRYYKIAENEFDKEFLRTLNNAVAALFYTENCSGGELQHEIENIAGLIRKQRPEELRVFINWFEYIFHDRTELVEEITGMDEVKTMLRTSLKKYGEELIQEGIEKGIKQGIEQGMEKGIEKGKIETARKLLKKNMNINEIAEVTGLSVDVIRKQKV